MPKLFGLDIAKLIANAIGPGVLDATLTKVTPGSRTGNLTGGTNPTTQDFACKGFLDRQRVTYLAGTLVEAGRKVVVLLGATIDNGNTAPAPGDRITIEGTEYVIPEDGRIDRDPAAAVYICEVRPR